MSWAEIFKINKNMKRSLDEQLQDMKYNPIRVITTTGTYTPEKTGLYKVICVGAGGSGTYSSSSNTFGGGSGGGGGVAIKVMRLSTGTNYSVTVGTTASFAYAGGAVTATAGGSSNIGYSDGSGGTASGGDYNYTGTSGSQTGYMVGYTAPSPGSVGVVISDLSQTPHAESKWLNDRYIALRYGDSIMNYGGAGTGAGVYDSSKNYYGGVSIPGKPAAILIVPLEMEE